MFPSGTAKRSSCIETESAGRIIHETTYPFFAMEELFQILAKQFADGWKAVAEEVFMAVGYIFEDRKTGDPSPINDCEIHLQWRSQMASKIPLFD